MNIPQIYLVEPYNAYAPKGRKKHWHEVVEEQALMARIIAEQQALQQAINEASSKTLPDNSPATSVPTVGGIPQGGAGGTPAWDFWNPSSDTVNFSFLPNGGFAPVTIVFTNLTTTPQFDTYKWTFGDGTTSTASNPTHVYQSGSSVVPYTCSLEVSNSITGKGGGKDIQYISASIPVVTAGFSVSTSSLAAPFSMSFVNASTNNSQTPTTTYKWIFTNNGVVTTSSLLTPPNLLVQSGSITASLQATGSYNIAATTTDSHYSASAPTVTAGFNVFTSSNFAPLTASFTVTASTTNNGTLAYKWDFGDSTTSSLAVPPAHYYDTGSFNVRLSVTESWYNVANTTQLAGQAVGGITASIETVTAAFTVTGNVTSSAGFYTASVGSSLTFVNGSTTSNGKPLTYAWNFGSASAASTASSPAQVFTTASTYTVLLGATGSYSIKNAASRNIRIV